VKAAGVLSFPIGTHGFAAKGGQGESSLRIRALTATDRLAPQISPKLSRSLSYSPNRVNNLVAIGVMK
ncbi:MAG: hypothetical protein KDA84_28870, partial [Planctomycetaceae bacterium]|nr:hypothetical protein [Planctomycetaceae bacterium]